MFPKIIRFSCVIFTVFSFRRRIDLRDFVRSVKTVVLGVFTAENRGWHIRRFQTRRTVYRSDSVKTQLTRIQPRTTVSLSEITLRYFPTNGCFDPKTTVSYNAICIENRRTVYRSDDVKTQLTRIQPRTTVSLSEITLRYFPTNGCFDTKTTVSYNSMYMG